MKIFDTHFHIIDDYYPLVANNGYLPPIFKVQDYQKNTQNFGVKGGAIVSGSFQAFDQSYLLNALQVLGENYVGVANIPYNISVEELEKLDKAGVVAVRFNVKRGGSESISYLQHMSNQLYEQLGWHTELYVDNCNLKDLESILSTIPAFSIDHLGLSKAGLSDLYRWVEKGIRVKATGFGRIDFDPIPVMKQIYNINPEALMFGTDLPSTRAETPFSWADMELIQQYFSEQEQEHIFFENGKKWYFK